MILPLLAIPYPKIHGDGDELATKTTWHWRLGGHYIAMLATSRALSGIFMWHARFDITCLPLLEGLNHVPRWMCRKKTRTPC